MTRRLTSCFVLCALSCALSCALAEKAAHELRGQVVAITDGDTLKVLDTEKHQHTVRLAGIDAPEKRQPFGEKAKAALAAKVARRTVRVVWRTHDRYRRILGDVYVTHEGEHWVNRELVAAGMAWQYRRFDKRPELAAAEQAARKARRGLWSDPHPVAPWDWRQQHKAKKKAATATK